ncbi:MAG: flagellar motor switch protein FliN [Spongiibacteraceae bacterium]
MSEETDQDKLAAEWAAAMEEQGEEGQDDIDALLAASEEPAAPAAPAAQRAEFDEFDVTARNQRPGAPDLDVILDIPVRISMEVGNTEITIRNLLQLNQGSVIELDRLAGEPLDVLVNGTLIAHGEVVVVNEKFGIRMTDVISPSERIKKLR